MLVFFQGIQGTDIKGLVMISSTASSARKEDLCTFFSNSKM